jgi:hypothetical protein
MTVYPKVGLNDAPLTEIEIERKHRLRRRRERE